MEAVPQDLGFRMPQQTLREEVLSHVLVSGRYDMLQKFVARYDAFQDVPFSQEQLYVALDALFLNSMFILTLHYADAWFDSALGFHKEIFGFQYPEDAGAEFWANVHWHHKNYAFEQQKRLATTVQNGVSVVRWDLLYDRTYCIARYRARNDEIIRYFRNPPSVFLSIDVSHEADTSKICAFFGVNESKVSPLPKLSAR
ncbi:sulfotransferase [Ruegeria arenilitoris]|uniref:sulfotransferase n=1 Tax=Ruegeria arenilitoris TaxID=1173585 RepID=UPI001C984A34|nr:sulfotransferase [Ruegeria arenilitoris]MBY6081846.1 hypothetical protein [Ruegeria arenilitoris]